MDNHLLYLLPTDTEKIGTILEVLSSRSWTWLDGRIDAPPDLISAGQAMENTGYNLTPQINRFPFVVPRDARFGGEAGVQPDWLGVLAYGLLPGFICFKKAGALEGGLDFETALRVSTDYIRKGYVGALHLYYCEVTKDSERHALVSHIFMGPWVHQRRTQKDRVEPPMVCLEWVAAQGGTREDYNLVLEGFRRLKLTPLDHFVSA